MISVIIPAAGYGKRMKSTVSKQHLQLGDKSILAHVLEVFQNHRLFDEIILVAARDEIEYMYDNYVVPYALSKVVKIVEGGLTRQESVYKGLCACSSECKYVFIHDGARPFISDVIIERLYEGVKKYNAVCPGVPVKDTIKRVDNDGIIIETLNRQELFAIQTPQAFAFQLIKDAHEAGKMFEATDDASLVERYLNKSVYIVEGEYTNIKLTTPEDMLIANALFTRVSEEL